MDKVAENPQIATYHVYLMDGTVLPLERNNQGIRTIQTQDGKVWYCAKDVLKQLGFNSNYSRRIRRCTSPQNRQLWLADTSINRAETWFVSEEGKEELKQPGILRPTLPRPESRPKTEIITFQDIANCPEPIRIIKVDEAPWYVVQDICRILGYTNSTYLVKAHVSTKNYKMLTGMDANGRAHPLLAVNKAGITELLKKIQGIRELKAESEHKTAYVSTRPTGDVTAEQSIRNYQQWGWTPPYTTNIQASNKIINGQVQIHFTYGSNNLLKGAGVIPNSLGDINENTATENSQQVFTQSGYLINYPEEWKAEFEKNLPVVGIPSQHQLTLDLLMSDFIQSRRMYRTGNPKTVDEASWVNNPQFEFRLVEWFGAFHYTNQATKRSPSAERLTFYKWAKRVINSLCYLMRTGVIQPVTRDVTSQVQHLLQQILGWGCLNHSKVYTGATECAYTYTFRFAPNWIARMKSRLLPAPVRVPPILGRYIKGSNSFTGYKYTSNRLLCTATLDQRGYWTTEAGDLSLTVEQYCQVTGLPTFQQWVDSLNPAKPVSLRVRWTQYLTHMVTNVVNAYGLFSLANRKDLAPKIQKGQGLLTWPIPDSRRIILTPAQTF